MLTLNPAALRSLTPPTTETAGNTPGLNADPAGFASLLRQTQVAPAPMPMPMPAPAPSPAPAPAASPQAGDNASTSAHAAPDEAADAPAKPAGDATAPAAPASRPRPALKTTPRAIDDRIDPKRDADRSDGTPAAGNDPNAGTAADKAGDTAAASAPGTDAPVAPTLVQWMVDLQRAGAAHADSARTGDARAEGAGAATDAAPGDARSTRAADLKADADLKDKATTGKASHADAARNGEFAAALAEQRPGEAAPALPPSRALDGVQDVTAASAAFTPPAATAREATAAVAVAIATPLTAPDFPQALGLQLSVLARDGIQQAELHLNPAEMGPVSVQITMDGSQARVEFGADAAATRQALEAGLPQLASALQDAGFTLAGGGVSQHSRGRSDSGGGSDSGDTPRGDRAPRRASDATLARVGTAARRIVTAGGVDLFA